MHRVLSCCLAWVSFTLFLPAADEAETMLKSVVKNVRAGNQEALAPLKDLQASRLAAETILSLVSDKKIALGIKFRLAEIVAAWLPGEGRKALAEWLLKHPACGDDELQFFASISLLEGRTFFWNILTQVKGPFSEVKKPESVALAARALGAFRDNPEIVVTRVASMLDPANAHVIRACAADALGGMHHIMAFNALLPHWNDEAIGSNVRCSLYRLTGQDLGEDTSKWQSWFAQQGTRIAWQTHSVTDHADYLKLQKLLKPLDDDPAMNMDSFYGVQFRAKAALFILDVSGSMTIDDRINKLKAQMSNLLTAMQTKSSKLRYGILTFGETVDSCFPARGIEANDEKNHKQAVRFVERIQADGGTPMCEALTYALTKMLPAGNIDAIYFLSDGEPSDGTPEQVLDLARGIHQKFQTRIHTISIGEEPATGLDQPSLLQQIANACGGVFTIPP
jgi:uncharacterized protein YegL